MAAGARVAASMAAWCLGHGGIGTTRPLGEQLGEVKAGGSGWEFGADRPWRSAPKQSKEGDGERERERRSVRISRACCRECVW
ncbi:hypothetical protein BDA96_02G158700 [Sorghum bicolor]|uniref:Uncharacterized protein n=2 Tax=Sorghum bicolor TaxID=4558 RepID=A0A921RNQ3_SORBI|nr:hypothetical protein BDA96_02G158700 [Sorghum bicolor]KXG35286.1 hypothetical protein SORBI_3002G152400 [Sorghum bicolor]